MIKEYIKPRNYTESEKKEILTFFKNFFDENTQKWKDTFLFTLWFFQWDEKTQKFKKNPLYKLDNNKNPSKGILVNYLADPWIRNPQDCLNYLEQGYYIGLFLEKTNIFVVDVDSKGSVEFIKKFEPYMDPWMICKTNRGVHYFFSKDPSILCKEDSGYFCLANIYYDPIFKKNIILPDWRERKLIKIKSDEKLITTSKLPFFLYPLYPLKRGKIDEIQIHQGFAETNIPIHHRSNTLSALIFTYSQKYKNKEDLTLDNLLLLNNLLCDPPLDRERIVHTIKPAIISGKEKDKDIIKVEHISTLIEKLNLNANANTNTSAKAGKNILDIPSVEPVPEKTFVLGESNPNFANIDSKQVENDFGLILEIYPDIKKTMKYVEGEWYIYNHNRWLKADKSYLKKIGGQFLRLFRIPVKLTNFNNFLFAFESVLYDPFASRREHDYIGFSDGVYDCENESFLPHNPDYFTTFYFDFPYEQNEDPEFLFEFLKSCFQRPEQYILFLRCLIKALLCGFISSYQFFFLLSGKPGTGKSSIVNFFVEMIGHERVVVTNFKDLEKTDSKELANISEKLLIIINECPREIKEFPSVLKASVGGDLLRDRRMYKEARSARFNGLWILTSNGPIHFLSTGEEDKEAILRREMPFYFKRKPDILDNTLFERKYKSAGVGGKLIEEIPRAVRWGLNLAKEEVNNYMKDRETTFETLTADRIAMDARVQYHNKNIYIIGRIRAFVFNCIVPVPSTDGKLMLDTKMKNPEGIFPLFTLFYEKGKEDYIRNKKKYSGFSDIQDSHEKKEIEKSLNEEFDSMIIKHKDFIKTFENILIKEFNYDLQACKVHTDNGISYLGLKWAPDLNLSA